MNIYLSISRTNKSIPEWSTLFCLSILFFFNVLSTLRLLNIDIKGLEKNIFYVILGAIFGIHYLYFQMGNRIIKKITDLKPKLNLISRIMTVFYLFGTLSLFCYVVNIGLNYYLTLIIGIGLIIILGNYVFGTRNKQFD
ncbi:hypothetical protein BXY80_2730 [Ichthyenterobacterium magnum]|uniref:Uncharacterized protein n=1 Tax=Ichthyenterobacterium magnum TaxID=1230530 RepID=A0A420DEP6_9FLAO|nr:hypothetical protein BXY80_2730 [Ichthyenterobacterium magnum]